MSMNKAQCMKKLRMLLDQKPSITQKGRLVAHIANELNLTGKRTNGQQTRHLITVSLDELERLGYVTLEKSGSVYDAVHRVQQVSLTSDTIAPLEENMQPVPQNSHTPNDPSSGVDPMEVVRTALDTAERYKLWHYEEKIAHERTGNENATLTDSLRVANDTIAELRETIKQQRRDMEELANRPDIQLLAERLEALKQEQRV